MLALLSLLVRCRTLSLLGCAADAARCGAAVRDLQRVLATPAVPKPTLELARATLDSIAIDGDATF